MRVSALIVCISACMMFCAAAFCVDEKTWDDLTDQAIEQYRTGHHEEAVATARLALASGEELFGPEDLKIVGSLDDLATYLNAVGKADESDALYKRALHILEKKLPPDDPYLEIFLNYLAGFYKKAGRPDEAAKLEERARSIRRARMQKKETNTKEK